MKERGWDNSQPADLAKSIMIEGAELLELFQWDNPKPDKIKKDKETLEKIRSELADVMIYCFDLATVLGIDIEKSLNDKLEYVKKKYPAKIFNKENYTANRANTKGEYWKIKQKYRKGKKQS